MARFHRASTVSAEHKPIDVNYLKRLHNAVCIGRSALKNLKHSTHLQCNLIPGIHAHMLSSGENQLVSFHNDLFVTFLFHFNKILTPDFIPFNSTLIHC